MAVVVDLLVLPALHPEVLEDHRLVRARAERFAEGEEDHRHREERVRCREEEHHERYDVRAEGDDHGAAAPHRVGEDPRRHLHDVDGDELNRIERAYLQKRKSFLEKKEHEEGLEELEVLEKAVEAEFVEHRVFCERLHCRILSASMGFMLLFKKEDSSSACGCAGEGEKDPHRAVKPRRVCPEKL